VRDGEGRGGGRELSPAVYQLRVAANAAELSGVIYILSHKEHGDYTPERVISAQGTRSREQSRTSQERAALALSLMALFNICQRPSPVAV